MRGKSAAVMQGPDNCYAGWHNRTITSVPVNGHKQIYDTNDSRVIYLYRVKEIPCF